MYSGSVKTSNFDSQSRHDAAAVDHQERDASPLGQSVIGGERGRKDLPVGRLGALVRRNQERCKRDEAHRIPHC